MSLSICNIHFTLMLSYLKISNIFSSSVRYSQNIAILYYQLCYISMDIFSQGQTKSTCMPIFHRFQQNRKKSLIRIFIFNNMFPFSINKLTSEEKHFQSSELNLSTDHNSIHLSRLNNLICLTTENCNLFHCLINTNKTGNVNIFLPKSMLKLAYNLVLGHRK